MIPRRRSTRRKQGIAAAELALMLPVLGLICVIAIDYSRLFSILATLSDCARTGAYYYATTSSATTSTVQQVALNDVKNWSVPPTVTSSNATDSNGNVIVQVTVTTSFTTIANSLGSSMSTSLSRKVSMIRTY